ncbi:C2H2-type zinc finger domain-containing protein [Spironucleus salmonicida]|uniref:C2H2-type zinc finger domain-containing protein n=1 Tax=Spironucleus salmonicida TaxID=348837 RepID=V6LK74_9EUKA|nr:C2H2-type zinc finger domain-containing protein [Spironucleus salmonicida]|eukprot:EST45025.1 C2H2-type zinc finger domain-containing protein [Spironucleus salmonicida]
MTSLETSTSQSSYNGNHAIQSSISSIVTIYKPVKCTLCNVNFVTRQEQLDHYHTEYHIQKAQKSIQTKFEDTVSKYVSKQPQNIYTQNVLIDIDASNMQSGDFLVFFCDDCKMEFTKESGYLAHLKSKKHFKNCLKSEIQIQSSKDLHETEDIE